MKRSNKVSTSSRIALQFSAWIAAISCVIFVFINSSFLFGRLRASSMDLQQYMMVKDSKPEDVLDKDDRIEIPGKGPGIPPKGPHTERILAFPTASFSATGYATFWGINRVRYINNRRWIVGQNEAHFVLLDVTQVVNRQVGLLYLSGILLAFVVAGSFILGRIFVKNSLRDLRALSQKLQKRDPANSNPSLIVNHLPADDEINNIALSIELLEDRIQNHYVNLRRFVTHVSHELKTPLMVMRSDVDLSARTHEFETLVGKLRTNITNMQDMVDTLLLLTRLQAEDEIKINTVELNPLIHDLVDNLTQKHQEKKIIYDISIPKNTTIQCHEHFAKICFTNLLDNAGKYSPESSTVKVGYQDEILTISNSGHMSSETLEHIRDPFRQADKNRIDGVGIGLPLVQQIARLHKWTITYSCENNIVSCSISFS